VPRIATRLRFADRLGSWKARWAIGRDTYIVPPGLYALGSPDEDAPVIVTANYKMSYDIVRAALDGRDAWLLVLETYGINVWCAAGKGTFGTDELIRRVKQSGLERVVTHRTLLLPILGAPGVAAHEVAKATGFRVTYAAIRATDLLAYLDRGRVTTPAMHSLTFSLWERLILTPVELVQALKILLPVALVLLLVGWLSAGLSLGVSLAVALLGAVVCGTVIAPALLPWLPGVRFAVKGTIVGLLWSGGWALWGAGSLGPAARLGAVLALTVVTAYYALNFTGSTPFTSRSGVRKEMTSALPAMASALAAAVLLWGWAALS